MNEIFEFYKEIGIVIDKNWNAEQMRHALIDIHESLRELLLEENVCPHCGGELVDKRVRLPYGEPPEYITVCIDCGYEVEE